MSIRAIFWLGVAALAALTLALILSASNGRQTPSQAQPLVPGLRDVVNEVDAINIVRGDGSALVSLRRETERWRVLEKDGYEADFAKVHDLLRDLAAGQRAHERTASPEWYGRLGVADIGQPDATGLAVSFPGRDLPTLIIGEVDSTDQGRFVRLTGEDQSWLSDRRVDTPSDAVRWLERGVMDIPAREFSEVTLRHPDGDTVILRAAGEEGRDWVLMNVPDGREAGPMWELRPVANSLASINLDDVRRHDKLPDDVIRALFVTRDGLNFVASLFEDEQGGWVHFSVSADVQATDEDELSEAEEELSIDAAAVDARLSPWQFRLSAGKFETMTRRLEDLLEPLDD
jgi:hypothetical protein